MSLCSARAPSHRVTRRASSARVDGLARAAMDASTSTVLFNAAFSSGMVLQQAPAQSAVYGTIALERVRNDSYAGSKVFRVILSVSGNDGSSYEVSAPVDGGGRWHALLRPTPADDVIWSIAAAPNHKHANNPDSTLTSVPSTREHAFMKWRV